MRVVGAGDALLAPSVTRRLISRVRRAPRLRPASTTGRTDAARAGGLRLLARGLSNAEIAAQLHLAEQTVKTHVSAVLFKLGLRDRVQAVVLAYESGIVVPVPVGRRPSRIDRGLTLR